MGVARQRRRKRLAIAGLALFTCGLGVSAIGALISGRLGWTNYWGGFVYAPFALIGAGLLAAVTFKAIRS
jgi:hypothetical protein